MILLARRLACCGAAISILAAALVLATDLPNRAGGKHAHAEPQSPQLDIVLLLDQSSSMVTNDSPGMRFKGARLFVELMAQEDRVALVRFAKDGSVVGPGFAAGKADALGLIDTLSQENIPEDGNPTDMRGGLERALDLLEGRSAQESSPRVAVVLFTDGAPCPGNIGQAIGIEARRAVVAQEKDEILRLAEQEFKPNGWVVYTLGLIASQSTDPCEQPDEGFLGDVAGRTGGEYHRATNGEEIIDGYIDILAAIYQLLKQEPVTPPGPRVSAWVPPKAQNLFVISRGGDTKVDLVPPPECPLAERSTSQVDEWGIVRQAVPCAGCWQVTSASPEVEIRSLVVALEFVISTQSPQAGQVLPAGSIPVVAELRWQRDSQVDVPVDDLSLLSQISNSVYAVAVSRPGGETVRKQLLQTATGSPRFQGALDLQEGKYDIRVEIVGVQCGTEALTWQGKIVGVTITPPPPTPTPTPSPTPTPTATQTVVPPPAEICNDNVDNDGDGKVDCHDPDCEKCGDGDGTWLVVLGIILALAIVGIGAVYLLYLRGLPKAVGRLESDQLSGRPREMETFRKHHLVLGTGVNADIKLLPNTNLAPRQADLMGETVEGFLCTRIINRGSQGFSMRIQARGANHANTKTEHILRDGDTILFAPSGQPDKAVAELRYVYPGQTRFSGTTGRV